MDGWVRDARANVAHDVPRPLSVQTSGPELRSEGTEEIERHSIHPTNVPVLAATRKEPSAQKMLGSLEYRVIQVL